VEAWWRQKQVVGEVAGVVVVLGHEAGTVCDPSSHVFFASKYAAVFAVVLMVVVVGIVVSWST
jgi:hypothetical protein